MKKKIKELAKALSLLAILTANETVCARQAQSYTASHPKEPFKARKIFDGKVYLRIFDGGIINIAGKNTGKQYRVYVNKEIRSCIYKTIRKKVELDDNHPMAMARAMVWGNFVEGQRQIDFYATKILIIYIFPQSVSDKVYKSI